MVVVIVMVSAGAHSIAPASACKERFWLRPRNEKCDMVSLSNNPRNHGEVERQSCSSSTYFRFAGCVAHDAAGTFDHQEGGETHTLRSRHN